MKKILSSVMALILTATTAVTPFGAAISNFISRTSITASAEEDYDEDYDYYDEIYTYGDFRYSYVYDYDDDDNEIQEVQIVNYIGSDSDVVIPSQINGIDVVSIADNAFQYYDEDEEEYESNLTVTNVVIPDAVTEIGYAAFADCENLESINLPGSVTDIASYAFKNCMSLKSITLPEGISSIYNNTFSGCSSLTSITIPDGVTYIDYEAFSGCSMLSDITILSNNIEFIGCDVFTGTPFLDNQTTDVKYAGNWAVDYNQAATSISVKPGTVGIADSAFAAYWNEDAETFISNITSVSIPDSVKYIGSGAFYSCNKLTNVTLPENLDVINDWAFGNTALTGITIPKSVKYIDEYAFGYICDETDYEEITQVDNFLIKCYKGTEGQDYARYNDFEYELFDPQSPDYRYEINDDEDAEEKTITITSYDGQESNVTVPSEIDGYPVTNVDGFLYCSTITSVTIPDGIENINSYAFSSCKNLRSVEIPDSIESIGRYAFDNTPFLNDQKTDVKYAGKWAVGCDENAETVSVKQGTVGIADYAFSGVLGEDTEEYYSIKSATIPDTVKYIGHGTFSNCIDLESVILPDSIESIGMYAFFGCENLASIKIPSGLTVIEPYTFFNCAKLKKVNISGNIAEIGWCAFENCSGLTSVTILNGIKVISENAFFNCKSLKRVTIPSTVVNVGDMAFGYMDGDESTDWECTKVPGFKIYCYEDTKGYCYASDKGFDYEIITTPPHEHLYTGKVTKQPTCTEKGIMTYTCSKCSVSYTETIKALGHSNKSISKKSTYFEKGYTAQQCTRCGAITNKKNTSILQMAAPKATVGANSIKLTWNKAAGAQGYEVWQLRSGKWTKIKTTSSTTFTVSKLPAGTSQKFAIKPYTKKNGRIVYGCFSKQLYTSTNPATVNFRLTAGSNKATVKWNKVTGASGYKVYYKTASSGWKLLKTVNNSTTSFTKTGLTKGKTYYFTVRAYRTINGTTFNGAFATKSVKVK